MDTKKTMDWKLLDSEYLFKRPWLTARRDVVELPDGRVMNEYYVLEYPTWINVVAITTEGEMLLTRQYRHALGRTCFEIVAGVVEKNEEPLAAAKRELREETGYGDGEWEELMVISANASTMNNLTHCYLAKNIHRIGEQKLDDMEDIEVYRYSQDEVLNMLEHGEFMQSLMIAPLQKYFYTKR